jgi:cytochrome c biogenesis protein CcmG, thiol:disulfide interchange protein DsbE
VLYRAWDFGEWGKPMRGAMASAGARLKLGIAAAAILTVPILSAAFMGMSAPSSAQSAAARPARAPSRPTVGRLAPDFSLVTFAGDRFSRDQMRGQVIVINIWATWCAPCRAEMPMMHSYYAANRERGLAMFGVTTESSVSPRHPALQRVSSALAYPLSNQMRGPYGNNVTAVPTTYIIDRAGIVREIHTGAYSAETFRAAVSPLLAEPAPAG